jgi:casein kinase 1 alpha
MNALLGIRLTRRDDLESLAYVLIYLMHGSLPWQSTTGKSTSELLDMRMAITPSTLCEGLPAEFAVFLNYTRSLEFKQKPDYQYLRDLFSGLRETDHSVDDTDSDLLPVLKDPHLKRLKPLKAVKKRNEVPVPPSTRR